MKILLIYPNPCHNSEPQKINPFVWSLSKFIITKVFRFPLPYFPTQDFLLPPLSLLVAAANIPPEIEVELVDERFEEINYNCNTDLVGISVMTSAANHSYSMAKKFKEKGIPVILGGIHPSLLPDEAAKYSDSIVIGEVEGLWEEIIDDCRKKRLKKIYKKEELASLVNLPVPRFDLLKKKHYITTNILETSRGCPHQCSFCASNKIFGNKYRFRPVEDIINEIKIRGLENQHIIFMSDNVFGNKKFSESLFSKLTPLNITWQGGSTISIAMYPNLLKLAAKSGCKSLLIGFESIKASNLSKINKTQNSNPENYPLLIKRIHQEKIGITGNFIVGLDDDQISIFKEISKFVYKNNIECPQISILIPYPGTKLHEEFLSENRIFDLDWSHYSNISGNVVFKPQNMSPSELENGYWKILKDSYTSWSIIKRLASTRNFLSFYLPYNIVLKTNTRIA